MRENGVPRPGDLIRVTSEFNTDQGLCLAISVTEEPMVKWLYRVLLLTPQMTLRANYCTTLEEDMTWTRVNDEPE